MIVGIQITEPPSLCFPDPGWSGKEEGYLPCSGAAFYERHNGSSLPCSRKDHHCQKLPTWLRHRGEMMLVSLWKTHIWSSNFSPHSWRRNPNANRLLSNGLFLLVCVPLTFSLSSLQVIELCRPSDSRLEHVDFECLFSSLSLRLLLRVFASLLLERRVIFTADKLRFAPTTYCYRARRLVCSPDLKITYSVLAISCSPGAGGVIAVL